MKNEEGSRPLQSTTTGALVHFFKGSERGFFEENQIEIRADILFYMMILVQFMLQIIVLATIRKKYWKYNDFCDTLGK